MAAEQKLEKPILEKLTVPTSAVEKIVTPENKTEITPSIREKENEIKAAPIVSKVSNTVQSPVATNYQQKRAQEIDAILSDGLNEVFLKMKPAEQKIFQKQGEETVRKINELLSHTKVQINKIISLIRKWLALITGINKFFLEQEVKIKADKIIRLKDK
ncbi:MAG: hypothetical protein ACYC40_01130 [Patescibacteria group bacterium]